jgi:hypothetical protein
MAVKQLPGRAATHDGLFPCLPNHASDPAFLLDDQRAITYTNKTTSHLLGLPGRSDPSRIAGLASERRGSTHD